MGYKLMHEIPESYDYADYLERDEDEISSENGIRHALIICNGKKRGYPNHHLIMLKSGRKIKKSLVNVGYTVNLYVNVTMDELKTVIKEDVQSLGSEEIFRYALFILGHGDNLLLLDNNRLGLPKPILLKWISKIDALQGVGKVVYLGGCRKIDGDRQRNVEYKLQHMKDMLVAFPCIEGSTSMLDQYQQVLVVPHFLALHIDRKKHNNWMTLFEDVYISVDKFSRATRDGAPGFEAPPIFSNTSPGLSVWE